MKTLALFLLLLAVSLSAQLPPTILPSITYTAGGVFTLGLNAGGDPAPKYQWYVSGVKVKTPDAQTPTLAIKPPYVPGLYVCQVYNEVGTITTSAIRIATTTVKDAADITITIKK